MCRPVAGACDTAESCTGDGVGCPNDAFVTQGVECRAVADACDLAEQCSGGEAACPADATKEGLEGATCAFDRGLEPAECAGTTMPSQVARRFDRAGAMVARAMKAKTARRRKVLKQAGRSLARAADLVNAAQSREAGPISNDCADALRDLLFDAMHRLRSARLASRANARR